MTLFQVILTYISESREIVPLNFVGTVLVNSVAKHTKKAETLKRRTTASAVLLLLNNHTRFRNSWQR